MIERYETHAMRVIWSDENKFRNWLLVELAVLKAKAQMGQVHTKVVSRIKKQAKFTVDRINEIDGEIGHDLLAFVQVVQENLDIDLRPFFHQDVTSYDIQEPAAALITRDAIGILFESLVFLMNEVKAKALRYKYLFKIQRTHGQHAEPSTLGLELL